MSFEELVKFYFDRMHNTQELWGVYLTVLLGVIAFWGGLKRSPKSIISAIFLSAGFIGFAVVNDLAIERSQNAQNQVQKIIDRYPDTPADKPSPIIIKAMRDVVMTPQPQAIYCVRLWHALGDILILSAIWLSTLFPSRPIARDSLRSPPERSR